MSTLNSSLAPGVAEAPAAAPGESIALRLRRLVFRLRPEEAIALLFLLPTTWLTLTAHRYAREVGMLGERTAGGLWRLLAAAALLGLLALGLRLRPRSRVLLGLREVLPFLACILIYTNLHDTIGFVNTHDVHYLLDAMDRVLFGVQPCVWAQQFITPARTELMQFFYLSFAWIAPSAPLILLARRRWREFRTATLGILVCFYLGYALYVAFPAAPPRLVLVYEFTRSLEGYTRLFSSMSAQAFALLPVDSRAAFPSLHAAVSLAALVFSWRYLRVWFWVLLPFVTGLWVSTVYLRHHYTVDLLAGWALVPLALALARRLDRWWSRRQREAGVDPARGAPLSYSRLRRVFSAGRGRRFLQNSALAAGSLAVTLGALEMAARWAETRPAEPIAAAYTQFDPLLGWRHRAGARVHSPRGDIHINSMGLRDRERTYRGVPGVRRVLVLGDSFAEGFSVKQEEAVSQVLERALDARGCAVEVLNAGTVGYSTDQEFLFYREEGSRYAPAVVALFLYYNDVLYNGRESVASTPKPLFTFTGGTARLKNVPLPAAEPFRGGAPAPRMHGSAGARWVRARLAAAAPGLYDGLARLRFWSPLPRADPPLELQVYARDPPPEIERAWEFTEHLLAALHREVARAGARLVVVYVPSKMEVSERDWENTRRRYRVDETVWDRRRLASLLARTGARAGFPVIDPTAELRAADRGWRGGPYHSGGGHWNASGHEVVAKRLEAFLTREGWIVCP